MTELQTWVDVPGARTSAETCESPAAASATDLESLRAALRWVTLQPRRETVVDLSWVDELHAAPVVALLAATHSRAVAANSTVHVRGLSPEIHRTLGRAGLGSLSAGSRRAGVVLFA